MKKHLISFVLIFQIMLLSFGLGVLSFNSFNFTNGVVASQTTATSEITAPETLEDLQNANDKQFEEWSKLEKFDGREYDYVTPQRNQSSSPLCWAFATTGLAEVSILREGIANGQSNRTLDLDDRHIAWSSLNRLESLDPLLLTKDDIADSEISWFGPGYLKDACLSLANGYFPCARANRRQPRKRYVVRVYRRTGYNH